MIPTHLVAINVKENSKEYEDFLSLYHMAFPPIEQIPENFFQASIHAEGASVTAYYTEETFVGFTYTIETEHFLFLYFFAIEPELRSQGFGSEIIRNHLMKRYPGKPIVLNAEAPDDAAEDNVVRLRRIAFYEHVGFVQLNYKFYDERILFRILCTSPDLNIDEYEAFLKMGYSIQNIGESVHILPAE